MSTVSRRAFLAGTIAAAAQHALPASIAFPATVFPKEPRRRIAVASYPFRQFIVAPANDERDAGKPGMDLAAFARFVRQEFQVYGIEPLHAHFTSTSRADILRLRAALDAAGVFVANIPVDAPVDLCNPDPAVRKAGNATYRQWIDIAKLLRSPSVRVWIPKCADSADLSQAAKALQPSLEYARLQGIVMNLENDDPVFDSVSRVLQVIAQAHTPFLRALPDFGNGLMGGDEAFNARGVEAMFANAWNISHVKDAEQIHGQRRTASLTQLFGIARAANYRGYYSMESDANMDPTVDTRHLIEEALRLM